jgi:uncharacterized protein (UPF0335 family)
MSEDNSRAVIGHNSVVSDDLKQMVERIERVAAEKDERASDIKDLYTEAKAKGFDTKILRKVIARRKRDRIELENEIHQIEVYEHALGALLE